MRIEPNQDDVRWLFCISLVVSSTIIAALLLLLAGCASKQPRQLPPSPPSPPTKIAKREAIAPLAAIIPKQFSMVWDYPHTNAGPNVQSNIVFWVWTNGNPMIAAMRRWTNVGTNMSVKLPLTWNKMFMGVSASNKLTKMERLSP